LKRERKKYHWELELGSVMKKIASENHVKLCEIDSRKSKFGHHIVGTSLNTSAYCLAM